MAMAKNAPMPIPASAPVDSPVGPGVGPGVGVGVGEGVWEVSPIGGNVGPGVMLGEIGTRELPEDGVDRVELVTEGSGMMNPPLPEFAIAVNVVMPVV